MCIFDSYKVEIYELFILGKFTCKNVIVNLINNIVLLKRGFK